MVKIRPADNRDADRIRELVFSILAEYKLSGDPLGTDADLADIEASYRGCGGFFDVVEMDGVIVGTVGLHPCDFRECELRKMYVHRDHRRSGMGGMLARRAVGEARRLGFRRVRLETAAVLKDAIRLYEAMGFILSEEKPRSARCDAVYSLELDSGRLKGGAQ
jgi:putative acetyltransferase